MRLTVYTSSSDAVVDRYRDAVVELGRAMGARGDELVYGGTAVGLMGVLAASVRDAGIRVTGVIPRLMVERGLEDRGCDERVGPLDHELLDHLDTYEPSDLPAKWV